MSNPLLALLNASAGQAFASPSVGSATSASHQESSARTAASPSAASQSQAQTYQNDGRASNTLSANDLLARLTQSATSPASSSLASTPAHVSTHAYNGVSGAQQSARSPPPQSRHTANDLLQSLLSPRNGSTPQTEVPPQASQAVKTQSQAQTSASDLLALLGNAMLQPVNPSEDVSPAPVEEQSTHKPSNGAESDSNATVGNAASASTNAAPPAQLFMMAMKSPTQSQPKSRARVPTIFDSNNMFDLLAQDQQSDSATSSSTKETTSQPQPKATKPSAQPRATTSTSSSRAASSASRAKATQEQAPAQPAKAEQPFEDDRNLHARRHLVGLRASSGFHDAISSGLSTTVKDGIQHITLDLLAPQPAGCGSLYAAKLEVTPISLLPAAFTPPQIMPLPQERSASQHWPRQTIAALGSSVILYSMSKGRVRIIHQDVGTRAMAKLPGAAGTSAVPSIFCGHGVRSLGGRSYWSFGLIVGTRVGFWVLDTTFGSDAAEPRLVYDISSDSRQTVQAHYIPGTDDCEVALTSVSGLVERLVLPQLPVDLLASDKTPQVVHVADAPGNTIRLPVFETDTWQVQVDAAGSTLVSVSALYNKAQKVRVALTSLQNFNAPEETFDIVLPNTETDAIDSLTVLGSTHVVIGLQLNTILVFVDLHQHKITHTVHLAAGHKKHFAQIAWDPFNSTLILSSSLRSSIFTVRPFLHDLQRDVTQGPMRSDKARSFEGRELALDTAFKECVMNEAWLCAYAMRASSPSEAVRIAASTASGLQVAVLPAEAMVRREAQSDMAPSLSYSHGDTDRSATTSLETPDAPREQTASSALASDSADVIDVDAIASTQEAADNAKVDVDAHAESRSSNANGEVSGQVPSLLAAMERNILDAVSAVEEGGKGSNIVNAQEVAQLVVDQLNPVLSSAIEESLRKEVLHRVVDVVQTSLPQEISAVILRADVTAHLTKSISASIVAPVQRTAMDVVSRVLAPHFEEIMGDLTSRIENRIDSNLTSIRKDIVTEQSKALVGTEAAIGSLLDEVAKLQGITESLVRQNAKHEETIERLVAAQASRAQGAPQPIPQPPIATPAYEKPAPAPFQPMASYSRQPSQSQVSHYLSPPSVPTPQPYSAPAKPHISGADVEDSLLEVLSAPTLDVDAAGLRNVLTSLESSFGAPRSAIFDEQGKSRVSQAVILTLLHRLVKALNKAPGSTAEMMPEQAVPWIECCCVSLDRNDQTVAPYLHGLRPELVEGLINAHMKFARSNRLPWWTQERLGFGALHYLQ